MAAAGWQAGAGSAPIDRYYRFVNERLQRADGYVLDGAGRDVKRLYNWPWVMQLHLEMAHLTGDRRCWERLVTTVERFYSEGGDGFYPIGLPVLDTVQALTAAGMVGHRDRALTLFRQHGERGTDYPVSEVNFEQGIVAPAVITLLELHAATREDRWWRAARPHIELLELFEGRQPHHRLNGISIRHWDSYWFGKRRMWGDTFPHYWSSLNALAWNLVGTSSGEARWQRRAETVIRNNLSLFSTDGRGYCAHVVPTTVSGRVAATTDPYANDQDWALVHLLQLHERGLAVGGVWDRR